MANPEHVKLVCQGAVAIAKWRQNRYVRLNLSEANLSDADLSGADLSGADLHKANLTGVDLHGADLAEAELSAAALTGANLARSNLSRARLETANLSSANLFWANLFRANLTFANLTGSDFTRTILVGANLVRSKLTAAKLFQTTLAEAYLFQAELTRADLTEAVLGSTSLGDCDLSAATGLSAVDHVGPSSIGVDTLIRSFRGAGNKLTPDLEAFFLGAGVPKELLTRLPEIVGAVEFYSCFISYGQPDLDLAKRLRDDLEAKGVSCWLYDLDATPGERTWKEIGRKRREADKMLVICSVPALIRDGVLKEIEEQIDEDPNKILPISRDNTWNQPGFPVVRGSRQLKPFVEDRNYADFSDESRYEESMQRLLKALRRKTG